jgi:uncharacterized protein (UPF0548 family)
VNPLREQLPHRRALRVDQLDALRTVKRAADFNYSELGATAGELPVGYRHVDRSWNLGHGTQCFEAAKRALFAWRALPNWLHAYPDPVTASDGDVLVLQMHLFGLWWISAVRLLPAEEREDSARVAALTYGALPGHHARGEERFEVRHCEDDRVVYRLRSFSRWKKILPRLMPPLANHLQARFAADSGANMIAAVREELKP